MKFNKWTVCLAAGGVVSLASAVQADEAQKPMSQVMTAVSATTLSGYVDTSIIWKPGTGDANLPAPDSESLLLAHGGEGISATPEHNSDFHIF